jgi:hypothetical protein
MSSKVCIQCRQVAPEPKRCGACRRALYCGVPCQRANWPKHKEGCRVFQEEMARISPETGDAQPRPQAAAWLLAVVKAKPAFLNAEASIIIACHKNSGIAVRLANDNLVPLLLGPDYRIYVFPRDEALKIMDRQTLQSDMNFDRAALAREFPTQWAFVQFFENDQYLMHRIKTPLCEMFQIQ